MSQKPRADRQDSRRFTRHFIKRLSSWLVLSTALTLGVRHYAQAAQQIWNPVGDGNWNTTTPNWDAGAFWTNGNTALFDSTGTLFSTVLVGAGGVTANGLEFDASGYTIGGAGTLTLGGTDTTVTVTNAGTSALIQSNVALTTNVEVGGAGDLTFNTGAISGAGFGLTKMDAGTLTLGGSNTFSGPVAIRGGTVSISAANHLGDGSATNTLTLAGGTLRVTSTFSLGVNRGPNIGLGDGTIEVTGANNLTVDGSLTVAAGLTGGVILTKTGTGILTLTGTNNTAAVATTITEGTVSVGSNANLGSGRVSLNGGTLQGTSSFTMANGISLGVAGGTVNVSSGATVQVGGVGVFGPGSLTKTGAGTLQLNVASLYAGATTISEGTLSGGVAAFLAPRTQLTVAGGAALNLNGFATSVASLSGAGVVTNTGASATLTLGNVLGNVNTTFSGVFNGSLSLSKNGGGTLTLTNSGTAGTATGAWTLTAGMIKLDYANAGSQVGNIINASIAPTFAGGTLQVTGRSGATVAQALGNVTLNAGGSVIRMVANGGTSTMLTLGTVPVSGSGGTATTAGGALLIDAPSGTAVRVTTTDVTNGTYGGRIVFYDGSNYNWAANGGGGSPRTLTGYGGYVSLVASGSVATTNYLQTDTLTDGLTGSQTVNSLKIATTTTGQSLDLNANTLTIATGGLLFTGAQDYTILTTGGLGTLKSGTLTNSDFIVQHYGTGVLTINAPIVANAGTSTLTKAGTGTLVLGAANTYTGGTFIDGGVLSISSSNALGASTTAAITISDGAMLRTTADVNTGTHTYSLTGGNATFDIANGTTLTVGGAISGAGGLTLNNTGTLILAAVATYTGPTFIGAGATLRGGIAGSITATGSGSLTVVAGGMVDINNFTMAVGSIAGSGTITNSGGTTATFSLGSATSSTTSTNQDSTFSGTLSGALNLAKNGGGVLTLTNPATYTGTTGVVNGGIVFGVNNALPTGALTIGNNAGPVTAFVDLNGFSWTAGTIGFYGSGASVSSQASLNIGAGGILTAGGTITVTATGNPLPAFIAGGTLDLGAATRTLAVNDSTSAAVDLTITSVISSTVGSFGITKTGAGTLLLTGLNTYLGGTVVNGAGGVLALGGAGTLGAANGFLTMTAGTLDLNGTSQGIGAFSGAAAGVVRNSAVGTHSTLTVGNGTLLTSSLSYAGTFIDGGGTLALAKNGAGILTLTGANTYSGGTQVNEGILVYANTSVQPSTGTTQVGPNGTLGLGIGSAGFFSLSDVDALFANTLPNVNMAAGASVGIDTTTGDVVYGTHQSAARGLAKLGANVLTLTGTNTYTGGTVLAAGTLSISSDANLGNAAGPLTILSGTTLRVTGTSNPTSNRLVSLQGTGTTTFDVVDPANVFTISANVSPGGVFTKAGSGALTFSGSFTTSSNILVTGGVLNLDGVVTGSPTATILAYGTAAGNSIVNVSNDMTLFGTKGSNVVGAVSVYNQTTGVVTITPGTSNGEYVSGNGGYGYFNLTGGTYKLSTTAQRFTVTAGASTGVVYLGGTGTLDYTGGEHFLVAYNGAGALGQFTIADSATVSRSGASQNLGVFWTSTGAYGVVNIAGGTFNNTGRGFQFGGGGGSNETGFVNLSAGTLIANGFTSNTAAGTGNLSFVNFAGGTYQAGGAHTLVGADGTGNIITTTLFGAIDNSAIGGPSFNGGAVIDTNGFAVTANRSLAGATGFGVTQAAIVIPGTGNSGYIGAPAVQFSAPAGGGVPATGYALISGGVVTGIVITNPGTYASGETPLITLTGGGGTIVPFTTNALATANGSAGLTKTGNGTLTLSAINNYSGATTINGGTLSIAPIALPNTSGLTVGSTGSGTVDLYQDGVGAAWSMAANANLVLGSASNSGTLGFQLGTASDGIILSGSGALTVNAGGGFISAQALPGFGVGSYDVITGLSGVTGFSNLQLGLLPSGYSYSLTNPSGKITLNVFAVAAGNFYWTGDASSSWSTIAAGNSNWSTTANGLTDPGYTPGAANVVHFSASNASASPINTTLDNAFSIQGLKFLNSGTGAATIAPGTGGSLTIGADGIEVQAGAPASTTISAPVVLGSAQTWRVVDSGSQLTVSGVISGGLPNSTQASPASSISLTITGAGAVTIGGGANTFTGDILVDGGTLRISSLSGWGGPTVASSTSHTILLNNGGTLSVTSGLLNPTLATLTSYNLVQIGSGGGILDIAGGATLQLDDVGQFVGTGNVTKNGVGILALRSQTTFSGNLVIAAGTLQMSGTSGGFGSTAGTTTISSGAALNLNGQAVADVESLTISGTGLASAPAGVITNGSGTASSFAGPVILAADSSVGTAGGAITLSGGITGAFNLTNSGTGTGALTISGIIGANVGSVIQNSSTSALTFTAAANLWTGGLVIKAGTVNGGTNVNTFGGNTNVITLGDSSGAAPATLVIPSTLTYAQPIQIAAGNTGVVTINGGNTTGNPNLAGGITLNSHDLILTRTGTAPSGAGFVVSGGISSTGTGGNLVITNATTGTSAVSITLLGSVNHVGSITNNGTTTATTAITGVIGANVTDITQNSATSMLVLSGNNPNFVGTVTISNGTLQLGGASALNANSVVSIAASGTFNVNANGLIGGLSGLGTVANAGTAKTLTLGGSGNYTFGGAITATTPANLGLTVSLAGNGSQTLSGASTYTGATTINRGTLILNFDLSSTLTNLLSSSSPLILNGGALSVIGDALASSQTFASTTLSAGTQGVINATAGVGGLTLDLGVLTRGATSSLNINVTGSPVVTFSGFALSGGLPVTSNNAAFLTVNRTDWGAFSGGNLIVATYQNDDFSTPGTNVNVTASGSWNGTSVNSLRFNAGAPTLALSGANTLTAGGLLVGSGAGAVTLSGTGTLAGVAAAGTVAAPVPGELGVFQYSASALTIGVPIINPAAGLSYVTATPTGTAFNKYGSGMVILSSIKNAYTGGTNIANGVLRLGASEVLPDGAAQPGAVNIAGTATLDLAGFSETINGLSGAGLVDNTSATAATLFVGNAAATTTFTGILQNTGGAASLALTKIGTGTLTLTGANTYGGATTINMGGLTLSFSSAGAPLTNIISSASALGLGSGTLTIAGSTVVNSQSFNGTTLFGGGRVTLSGTTPAITLNLGAITRTAGTGATVNVTLVSPGVVTTTNTNDATGILGAWAVVNSADFATVTAGNIVAYTGYTAVAAATGAGNAAQNALLNSGASISGATVDYNTIKLAAAPTFSAAGNILRLGAIGAILLPTGGATTSLGSAANNGIITAGGAITNGAGELNLINWSANVLTVNSAISNNGTGVVTLVKSGTGSVTLTGTNTFTGATIINGGTLSITNSNQISASVILNGGTLSFNADASLTQALTLGAGGGTLTLAGISGGNRTFGATGNIGTTGTGPRIFTITGGGDNRLHTLQPNLIDGNGGSTSFVLSFTGDNRTLRLGGTNTYTGTTLITRGVLDFLTVGAIPGGITNAATIGNIIFGATGTSRAILQSSVVAPTAFTRTLGYGDGQVHWEGNGGFSNNSANTTWAVNLGGSGQTLVWGLGGFVPTGSILQFGVNSVTNSVTNIGAVDFQNDIDLGGVVRTIEAGSATDKHGNTPYDVILSGDLISSAGGGLNKTGSGVMILTGTNNTSTNTAVTLTAGVLIFGNLNAIPGSGANLTLSTTVGGNSAIGLVGDTNPIASLGSRIANPLTATSAFTLGADSSVDLDFTAFPNMRLAAYAFGLPAKAITYTGKITPANGTYLFGGTPYATDPANTLATTLVLANRNALTGSNALNLGYGALTLLDANDFTGGTVMDGNAIAISVLGIGSNAALGTGTLAMSGNQTKSIGAVNGDRYLANNIAWGGTATSWVLAADTGNDGVIGTSNGGGVTYLGTITISNTATAPTILSRTSHQALLLGDITNGLLTSGLTYSASTSGLISSLATAANGGVAKTYNGTSIINSTATLVIDSDSSLGGTGNISMGGGGSAGNTAVLRLQAGSGSVTLNASRTLSLSTDRNFEMRIGANDALTIAGVVNAQGTNTAARNIIKTDAGTLVFTNKNNYTGAATFSPGLAIRGGTLRLDSSSGSFTAALDRFFPDGTNALPLAFSVATGTFGGGGILEIIQAAGNGFALTQGFGNVTFNTGGNTISLVNNSVSQALALNLGGTFTRTILLGGTVNFLTSSSGGTNTIGSSVANTNGIIGGYATFNGVDWATQSGGNIIALAAGGYTTNLPGTGATATANYVDSQAAVTISASESINSLKLTPTAGGQTITVNTGIVLRNASNNATTSLGILFDNSNGSSLITSTTGGTGTGQLNTTGSELIIHTYGNSSTNKLELSGVVKGAATVLTKTGPGTLVLSGVNTYTGALIINAGVVEYANGSAGSMNLGNPTAGAANIIMNGGTLRQTATGNLIYGITVNGYSKLDVPTGLTLSQTAQGITGKSDVAGILQKTGAGTLTFSGSTDNPTLSLEVVSGIVNLGKNSTGLIHSVGYGSGSTVAAAMGAVLIVDGTATANITGSGGDQIHDQGSVVVRAGGTLNLGGGTATGESFDGLAGSGSVTNTSLTGTFTLTLGAGNSVNISSYSVAAAAVGLGSTGLNNFGGVISDGGVGKIVALTKTGGGTQILSNHNTYTGATTISAGVLQMGIANALPSGAGKGNVNIVGNGYGAGTINGGTSIGNADKVLAPGTLDMGGFDQAINGLNSSTGGFVVNNPTLGWNGSAWVAAASTNTLTVGIADANGSFNGAIRDGYTVAPGAVTAQSYIGQLSLTKVGTGTQVLGGTNTYTGPTTITGGTLSVGVSGSLSGTIATVATAATLNVGGAITTPAALTVSGILSGGSADGSAGIIKGAGGGVVVNSGGHVSPGTTDGLGSTAILTANAFSSATGAHLDIQLGGTTAGTQHDKLVVNSASATAIDLSSDSGGGTTLELSLAGYISHGYDLFFIIENVNALGSVHGTFANATTPFAIGADIYNTIDVGGIMFAIGYSGNASANSFTGGNDVVLMVVPEPNALAMFAGSLGLALGLQRFRRRRS